MINISELNSFPAQDGGSLAMLKEIAQRYCPEVWLEAAAMANFLTSEI